MFTLCKNDISCTELAQFLNAELMGENFFVNQPSTIHNLCDHSVMFIENLTDDIVEKLESHKCIVILTENAFPVSNCSLIVTPNPQLAFAQLVNEFFTDRDLPNIHPTAILSKEARIGDGVSVGPYSVIGPNVDIGDETLIMSGVVISGIVTIGRHCIIKDRAIIGSEGYSFINDEHGKPIHFPQFGRIFIGDRVWIGSGSTIERGAFQDTEIADNIKIDDLVHVGNGCKIGRNTMLTAGVILSENVRIGTRCWLMPNVSVRNSISITDRVTIGMGSVCVDDISKRGVYVGNPASQIK